MWHTCIAFGVAWSLCLAWAVPAQARPREEPLVEKVQKAINSGVGFLRDQQRQNGDWEVNADSQTWHGGWTSLAMLALLNCGIKPHDPMIQRGLKWLRGVEAKDTYVVGLQTMVFAAAGETKDLGRIQRNVDWLIEAAVRDGGGDIKGWSYKKARPGREPDNSNTQYALLGLHEGHLAGAVIQRQVWKQLLKLYTDSQHPDGSWGYSDLRSQPSLTMTTAGLSGLIIAGMELNNGREQPNGNGTFKRCGVYDENPQVRKALDWIGDHFRLELKDPIRPIYYNLYGIERAGRLSGQRFLGRHDWYREGCEYLVNPERIREDGSWAADGQLDSWPVVSTSFALLFLSKGRTPVLISKLVHGPGEDWNNDRNDARHLVEFASKELFKRQPLAWQVFDA
ncbi:MAG TPA: prenyltransferase/squalene oxidase repeat-containing protein, partial [Gemmataceae bacterium]|nr:prenyltransferase/squalene oxidase repeat-containing protein [Gemmataceae bacterium]